MPEYKKVRKDRAYTHEEIHKLLQIADERMGVVILLLSSSGIRIGALCTLRLRYLENNKVTVYENTKEEYITFITPECKQAIDLYIDMRARYGENITGDSFLIREQFDVRAIFTKPRCISETALQIKLIDLTKRVGVRTKDVPIAHGFRKYFTTQLVNSKLNPEIREMLLGHKIGLASAYYRPTEQEIFQQYEKAVNNLTINEENRLKFKVELLESEKINYEKLDAKIDALARKFLTNNVTVGASEEDGGRSMTEEEIQHILKRRRMRDNIRRRRDKQLLQELNQ